MFYSYFKHPNKNCMSYFKHCKLSLYFSGRMFIGSLQAIIHAFIPKLYKTSTSSITTNIMTIIKTEGCT